MAALIMIFGALTFGAGAFIVRSPAHICGYLRKQVGTIVLHVLNVAIRIVFGLVMLSLSGSSKFPYVTNTIGWFCIGIAIFLTVIGRKRFNRSISWAISLVENHSSIAGCLIMTFGAFLIYAFI